jgi:hypothetical protein
LHGILKIKQQQKNNRTTHILISKYEKDTIFNDIDINNNYGKCTAVY